jgi:tellurite resistance protein TerC
MWVIFAVVIVASLFIDLFVMSNDEISLKKAAKMTLCWVSIALLFGAGIFFSLGGQKALEYVTSYAVEYSLSIDNMFVFLFIFSYFNVEQKFQPKVLFYGIIGAIILRFIFIFVGIQLINAFSWTIFVFGALLIYTGIKMLKGNHEDKKFDDNFAYKLLKKFLRFTDSPHKGKFFLRENNLLCATSMFATVFVVEISDIIFAVDSIPAVLSISSDEFIVFTSNIFAVIGLRSLYFLLSGLAGKFKFLKYGVAFILFFIGLKMLCSEIIHIPTLISLGVIVLTLSVSVVSSFVYDKCVLSSRKPKF